MTDITQEIDELRKLSVGQLREKYTVVWGKEPRVRHSKEWLWKRIAWKLQEERFGGLSDVAKRRLEELIAEIKLPPAEAQRTVAGKLKPGSRADGTAAGTTLVREWRGQQIQVRVVDGGFEYAGVVHRSLSAVAQVITGSHWNGRLFFGLAKRGKKKSS